jgi:hypothetical protein
MVLFAAPQRGWQFARFEQEVARRTQAGAEVIYLSLGEAKLDVRGVDRLLGDPRLEAVCSGARDGWKTEVVIDLRRCTFADPYGLTAVHALCTRLAPRVAGVWVCLPVAPGVQAYLAVAGLADGIHRCGVELVGGVGPSLPPSGRCEVLLPVRAIGSEPDAASAAAAAKERIGGMLARLDWRPDVADGMVSAIMELTMNVVEYAATEGYLAVQGYRLDTSDGFVVAAISDGGVGIRRTLAGRHPELADPRVADADVLVRMFDESLSARAGSAGGLGMRTLQDAVEHIGGRLDVRSGRGLRRQVRRRVTRGDAAPIPGTHIRLELRRRHA